MMRGRYRDRVLDAAGRAALRTRWRPNAIVESCWPLLAGLLRNEEGLRGILYWAVGEGDAAWDGATPRSDAGATQLHAEIARVEVDPDDVVYVDRTGREVAGPTPRLEVRASFRWDEPRTLREFGIFGGDATEEPGSGRLINYVVHRRVNLASGSRLERRLRFSFHPEETIRWLEPGRHWLGERETLLIGGVGETYAAALAGAGVHTIDDLARAEPLQLDTGIAAIRFIELRSKARLALRVASQMRAAEGFLVRTALDVLMTPTATLAADAGVSEDDASHLREEVGALELTLDHHFLGRITIGELMSTT